MILLAKLAWESCLSTILLTPTNIFIWFVILITLSLFIIPFVIVLIVFLGYWLPFLLVCTVCIEVDQEVFSSAGVDPNPEHCIEKLFI